MFLVKGISKRVIVIKSPDPRLFEEAIFIVKEDALHKGVTQNTILKEARDVANHYVRSHRGKGSGRILSSLLYVLAGAGSATLIWFAANALF